MNPEINLSDAAELCENTRVESAELQTRLSDAQRNLLASEARIKALEQKLAEQTRELTESNLALRQNIEALKESKQRLREREAKLNSIFNAAVEGIITIDRNGRIVTANAAVKAILGYSEEELAGISINKLISPEQAEQHDQYIQDYIDKGNSKIIGSIREVEGLHKGGWIVPLDLSLAEFSIDGEIFFTGILRDITQRKLQEQEKRERLEELSHVTRLSLMGEMASGIAHEVNQPLTAIVAYTEVSISLLKMMHVGNGKLLDVLTKTHQQALRAGQIVHRMRDFIRSKAGSRTLVNINQLIKNCIGLCEADIKLQNIKLALELMTDLPSVYVNEVQIEQVVLNLLRNAIEAMKDLPCDHQRLLSIQTQLDLRQYIEIKVMDNGHGIPAADHAKIMSPFYTTKKNGMGMGLSISRSLVEAHHGALRFHSLPENGCTFYVTLPSKEQVNEF